MSQSHGIRRRLARWLTPGLDRHRRAVALEHALKAGGISVWTWDAASNVLTCEDWERQLLGSMPETWAPADFMRLVHEADRHHLAETLRRCVERGDRMAVQFRVLAEDGGARWLAARGAAVPNGQPGGDVVGVCYDVTDVRNTQTRLRRMNETRARQLQRLTHQLMMTEERERKRLARDLHDNLGQLLNVVRMGLAPLRGAERAPRDQVLKLEDLLAQASEATRSITRQLTPPILHELGLGPALESLADEMHVLYGLRVDVIGADAIDPLPEEIRVPLYRSTRELLINVAKHAGVHHAHLRLDRADGVVRVEVRDGGQGFDADAIAERADHAFGLFSIRERMQYLGGDMAIESAPGAGAIVVLTAPDDPSALAPIHPDDLSEDSLPDEGNHA